MLLTFRVANFRSIKDEQEFSLMRSRRISAHSKDGPVDREQVSTVAALYGNNASGKSNLINALAFMAKVVSDSYSSWKPDSGTAYHPFALDQVSSTVHSRFEVEFLLDQIRYQYGFTLDGKSITSEWLYAYPHTRRQTWFERDPSQDDEWYFGKGMKGRNRVITELTRPNSLFLSAAAASKHEALTPIYRWFTRGLRLVNQENFDSRVRFTIHQIDRHEESVETIRRLLKFADLGICDLKVRKTKISPELREKVRLLTQTMAESGSSPLTHQTADEVDDMIAEMTTTLELQHVCGESGDTVGLSFHDESLGTKTLLALGGPIAHALRSGDTLLVDEIDTSLHPHLVAELVNIFKSPTHNPKRAQLIFTSHDTTLLGNLLGDEPVLERDQIWLVQKDHTGSSFLYPLTDFHPRRLENIERGYLQGRYGGIPFANLHAITDQTAGSGEPE